MLQEHGVSIESDWPGGLPAVRRTGVVQLRQTTADAPSAPAGPSLPGVTATLWRSEGVDQIRSLNDLGEVPQGSVVWFNLDPIRAETTCASGAHEVETRSTFLVEQLQDWCPGLQAEMLQDLLQEDVQPKVESYGDEYGATRAVSVAAAIARETPDDDDFDGLDEEIVGQLVEILVGDGWLITCWHPSRAISSTTIESNDQSMLQEPFLCKVRHWWLTEGAAGTEGLTSSALGQHLVRALVGTYDATHRMMERWMADWEVTFYTCLSQRDKAERLQAAATEISNYLYMTAEIRRRLTALQHGRAATAEKTWFPCQTYLAPNTAPDTGLSDVEETIVKSLHSHKENFDRLSGDIRASMDVLMLQSTAMQQESTERVQNTLGLVTGIILVPTLVAGFFGANTKLPGGGTWLGFEGMVLIMLATGIAAYVLISRLSRK